jgi:riboflavin kinase/FMN adenylyltransferase
MIEGVARPAVTNIGVRPTFGGGALQTIEAHLLDFAGDLYGRPLRLAFLQRLREERAFDGVDALRAQITVDLGQARALFQRISL